MTSRNFLLNASIFLCIIFTSLFFTTSVQAQDHELTAKEKKELKKAKKKEKKNKQPEKGDVYFNPVPVIGSNPAFGFLYGIGAAVSAYLGEPADTKISSALIGVAFSTLKQTVITAKSTVYLDKNAWILNGDWRYLDSSQPTFGLGSGPMSSTLAGNGFEYDDNLFSSPIDQAQTMEFVFIRFYETFTRNLGNNFYAGVGIHLDIFKDFQDNLLDLDASTPVITSFYAYNESKGFDQDKSNLTGISFNGVYDSRDNQNNPYKGQYANIAYKVNPTFLGSDKGSSTLWMEYRTYLNLSHDNKNILGFWGLGNFTVSGVLPYMNLPAISWDQYAKTGRAYTQGRFRGQHWLYGEVELRKHLYGSKKNPTLLGMVLFANATTVTNTDAGVGLFDYVAPAGGAGLRINLNQKSRTNLDLDYGIGRYGSSGFYLRLNETF